ncbi:hypothetical protein [uncultured Anaerovibrio sp.]|uniref:hypothetical protein n=1 Tax=uncultured Anaerovibrio sp. TaxID=361586 RepID=UPI002607D750|nr:hypothetical protein [uncultured Anaerovibrio sp.]
MFRLAGCDFTVCSASLWRRLGVIALLGVVAWIGLSLGKFSPVSAAYDMSKMDTSIQGIIGIWREDGVLDSRILRVNQDYTYELSYRGGGASYGTIKVIGEEHPDGSYSPWYVFDEADGVNWASFGKTDEDGSLQTELWSGQDGAMHFVRCDSSDYRSTREGVAPKDYLGVWACGRCNIVIEQKDNAYIANMSWSSSASEHREWVYNCRYDKENAILVCMGNGICTDCTVYENGKENDVTVYDDGSCELIMRQGILRWNDKKDNTAQDMDFLR